MQLLFGHETAPIEGEALDDEQQGRSITVSMAERLARQQSAMKAWLQAEAESRIERAQNRRTRVVQHWPSGTRVCDWRADFPSMGSLPTILQGSTALNKHKGAWLGLAIVLEEMGRSQEQHEETHGTVRIVVQGRLLRCGFDHLRHLNERESLSIDRDKGDREKARTFADIVQDFGFSKGAHVDLRSQYDPPVGSEPRHISGKIFVRTPTVLPGTSSSGMRTETSPLLYRAAMNDSSEPKPAPETDGTHGEESPCMETDDLDTKTSAPEPPSVSQSVSPSQLPQHRIYGKREGAVVHERSVRPRLELLEEDELFVSSQVQSFREHVQEHVNDHGVGGIGAYTVLASAARETSETVYKDDSHLHSVSDEQCVLERSGEISCKTALLTQSHHSNDSQECRGEFEIAGSGEHEGSRSCKIR